ncbi:MAG: hypothetical protein WCO68_04085 [Verrucomicrobiota bacterium]
MKKLFILFFIAIASICPAIASENTDRTLVGDWKSLDKGHWEFHFTEKYTLAITNLRHNLIGHFSYYPILPEKVLIVDEGNLSLIDLSENKDGARFANELNATKLSTFIFKSENECILTLPSGAKVKLQRIVMQEEKEK